MVTFGKIGRRLLAWFTLIALIPLVFMGYQGYFFAGEAVQNEAFQHVQAIAKQKKSQIEQWFAERRSDVEVLAANPALVAACQGPELSAASKQELEQMLESYTAHSRAYEFLCLYRTDGHMLACTEHSEETLVELQSFVSEALVTGRPITGPIHLHQGIGLTIHLSHDVRDSSNKLTGTVIATLSLAHTLNPIILDTTGLGATGQAYLVDQHKVMLTPSRFMSHPDPLTHTMDSKGIQLALGGDSGTGFYEGFEGVHVIGSWEFLPAENWALITEINASEAFVPLEKLRRSTILVALGTLALILAVVGVISRSLSKPIRDLAIASSRVSKGGLDSKVEVSSNDELGELAESFNKMVASLKESQQKVVQSARLAAIGELAASVVHEIRNPLSVVKMNLRILETKGISEQPQYAEYLKLAKGQAERIEAMLADLLDYSKPITLNSEWLSNRLIVDRLNKDFEALLKEHDISSDVCVQGPEAIVSIDVNRMHQVFWNLLMNAVHAIEAANNSSREIVLATNADEDNVIFRLHDNGIGIREESIKRVFEPFYTSNKGGTGLGLTIVRKIVEAHGGHVTLSSVSGIGTEIAVVLPRRK